MKHRPGTGQEMSTLYSRRTRFDDTRPRAILFELAMDEWLDYEDDMEDYDDEYDYNDV